MTQQDKQSNQFHTASEFEVEDQQQYWNRYMNSGYQPAIPEDEEPKPHQERDWQPAHDPLNKAFDPEQTH